MNIYNIIDKCLPASLAYNVKLLVTYKDLFRAKVPPVMRFFNWWYKQKSSASAKNAAAENRKIEVAFILSNTGNWKSDYLFSEFKKNSNYHPFVVIAPYSVFRNYDKSDCMATAMRTKKFIEEKGFECKIPYDEKNDKWLDPKVLYNPDIVIFTFPYKDTYPQFYLYHYSDKTTIFQPYGYGCLSCYKFNYNLPLNNLVTYFPHENKYNMQKSFEYSTTKAVNGVTIGSFATEIFLDKNYVPSNPWKPQNHEKKKVIWGPHHSFDGLNLSTFLIHHENMLNLAKKYEDSIQFLFKPHPLLKFKLKNIWGEEKTNEYYNRWAEGVNTQIDESKYVDYFITSDAMIHDSGSFTAEYMHTQHPGMYLIKSDDIEKQFGPVGKKAFDCYYKGRTLDDIDNFLSEVVIKGIDPMKEDRQKLFDDCFALKDGIMPSKRMVHILDDDFGKKHID